MSVFPELEPYGPPPFPPSLVCIVDTSVLIEFKSLVKINEQWDLLQHMTQLVDGGHLAFPRQVAKELSVARYPDAPGAWIEGEVKGCLKYHEPSEQTLRRVLEVAERLVDVETTEDREVADPYVVAMALEIKEQFASCQVIVATNDFKDRMPLKMSLATACKKLQLDCCGAEALSNGHVTLRTHKLQTWRILPTP